MQDKFLLNAIIEGLKELEDIVNDEIKTKPGLWIIKEKIEEMQRNTFNDRYYSEDDDVVDPTHLSTTIPFSVSELMKEKLQESINRLYENETK